MPTMSSKDINKWWTRAVSKEQLRNSNHPKTKRRFEVANQISTMAPMPKRNAR